MGSQRWGVGVDLTKDVYRFGKDFELDTRNYQLRRDGRVLKLERIPMDVLCLLLERAGELVAREEIIEKIWGKGVFLDTDNSINSAVRKIRQVLRDDSERPRYIQTVIGRGYSFIAPVSGSMISPPPDIAAADRGVDSAPSPTFNTEFLLGRRIGDYRVTRFLGGGGMGVVFEAEDLKLSRQVAIKFLPEEHASDPKAFERLKREARAASAIDHPNICAVHQLGEHDGYPFMVMPFLQGETLRDWITTTFRDSSRSRIPRILKIAVQIADALDAAHGKGILHRDIKPTNIFIIANDQVKVLDFGVAEFLEHAESTGHAGSIEPAAAEANVTPEAELRLTESVSLGTPSYSSPEQIRREKLDARTDLFSLGLVLYEMCAGERAFRGSTSADVRRSILDDEYRPVREVNGSIPPQLSKVVGRCLEKDPSRRYQSAQELRSDLENIRSEVQPESTTPINRLQWLAAAAVALIVAMAGVTFFRPSGKAPKEQPFRVRRSVAVLGFRNLSGASDQDWISTALAEMLSTELDAGGQLRVVNGEEVAHMKLDLSLPTADSYSPQTLARIREQLGADDVIFGSFFRSPGKPDSSLRLDLRVQSATGGETVAALTTNGTEADLPDLVVRATSAVRDKLGIDAPSTAESRQAKSSLPSNPQALRLYSEGLERMRVFDALAARKYLEEAVAADPQSALSHSWLAESLYSLGYESKASEEAEKGFELSSSLLRPEQLLVEGRYRAFSHDYPAAVDIYRSLWKFFPDDIEAGLRVANMQNKSGAAKDALGTIADLRKLAAPGNEDPRIDIAEANVRDSLADFKGSEHAAASAIEKAQRSGSRLVLAQAKECDARAWDRLGQVDKSALEFAEARDLSLEGGNPRVFAYALNGIANGLYDKGDFEGALKVYEQALETARHIGALKDVASYSTNIGNVFFEQGKLPEARKLYEESLRVDRDLGNERNIASDLGSIGNVMQGMGDLAGALRMQEQSLQAFRHAGDRRGEASTLNNIGNVLSELGELELAESKYEEAMAVQQQIGYRRGRGYSLVSTADILRLQNHLSEARTKAEEALNLRREIGDNTNLAYSQMELANISLDQSNFSEAESLASQAAEAFRNQKVADAGCQAEAILSRALLAQTKLAAAEGAAGRAVSLCRQGSDRDARFEAFLASAEVSAQSGRRSEALKALNIVQSESKRYGYLVYEIRARLQLAELEFATGRSESGRADLAQVARDAEAHGLGLIVQKTKSVHG